MRRYSAGHALLLDFLVEEAEREEALGYAALRRRLASQAAVFDRLVTAVSGEHTREREARHRSSEEREAMRIERLLAGEQPDTSQRRYSARATAFSTSA